MTPRPSYIAFAQWLQANHPPVFAMALNRARGGLGDIDDIDVSLDTSIYDSTAGADIIAPDFSTASVDLSAPAGATADIAPGWTSSPAVSDVGSFLQNSSGLRTVLNAVNSAVSAPAAAQVIVTQAQRAAAGVAPANVTYTAVADPNTGEISAVPTMNGQTLTAAQIAALQPSFLQRYGIWLIFGAAALVVLN